MSDILTTARAARLLGVSVRTAQLWVESGELASWKTPGGHRRIPKSAVMDLIQVREQNAPKLAATAVVVTGDEPRKTLWTEQNFGQTGLVFNVTDDVVDAAVSIGETSPRVIVLDRVPPLQQEAFIRRLREDARFFGALIVLASEPSQQSFRDGQPRILFPAETAVEDIAQAIRDRLNEVGSPSPSGLPYAVPFNEAERLKAVQRSGLLFTPQEKSFDAIVHLAAKVTNAPIAMFTMVTADEQWFKAKVGFDGDRSPREWAFCNHTLIANKLTVLNNLQSDQRFANNPVVRDPYNFQFYAGVPVRDENSFMLGSLCIIDHVPRSLAGSEMDALLTLAEAASNIVRTRAQERQIRQLRQSW